MSDEDAIIVLDDRKKNMTVKHDPTMLVPCLNVNLDVINYKCFSSFFCTIIQDQHDDSEAHLNLDYEKIQSIEGVALLSKDSSKCLRALLDSK